MHKTICHLTSVHSRYDTRIFIKECQSLAKHFSVELIVADGKGDETGRDVKIYDVGNSKGRLNRFFKTTKRIYKKALEINADIYHLHDPELIPVGLKLKHQGKAIIFDAHEDLPKQILSKPYLPNWLRPILSFLVKKYEHYAGAKFDAIVAATPFIAKKFLTINSKTVVVNNYPILGELSSENISWNKKLKRVCYIGGITKARGILELIESLDYINAPDKILELVGKFSEAECAVAARKKLGFAKVYERGFLDREGVKEVLSRSMAGIVTFLPAPNHIDSQPNKMFEYMSSAIPLIASDFPLWRKIILDNQCGLCVDPQDPKAIAKAIIYIFEHPEEAKRMGKNGKKAVEEKYHWSKEFVKLYDLYKDLLA